MHHLQKYILDKLRFEQPLTFTDMLPDNVVSSHFQYHLKALQTEGLVEKKESGHYRLSHAGEAALEYLSVDRITPVRMPKVVSYTLLTHKDQLLLLQKQKEPYRHLIEPIAGKIHFGEEPVAAARREVWEKTGLHSSAPTFCGVANMAIMKAQKPLTHMIVYAHRVELKNLPSPLPAHMVIMSPAEVRKRHAECIPGTPRLIEAILQTDGTPFVINIQSTL